MKTKISFHSEVENDAAEAYRWYSEQSESAAENLLIQIEESLERIIETPRIYPKVHKNIRRALIRRFPYAIFNLYRLEKIDILAIFHEHRDPFQWKKRN